MCFEPFTFSLCSIRSIASMIFSVHIPAISFGIFGKALIWAIFAHLCLGFPFDINILSEIMLAFSGRKSNEEARVGLGHKYFSTEKFRDPDSYRRAPSLKSF